MKSKIFLISMVCIVLLIAVFAGNVIALEQPFKGTTIKILADADKIPKVSIIGPHIPLFEKETGINVVLVKLSEQDVHTRAVTIFAAKSPLADLVYSWAGYTAEWANAGFLEDITEWLTEEEWNEFVPGSLNAVSYKNRRYGLPYLYSVRCFLYNKKAFREAGLDPNKPPQTWDEYLEYAQKITNPKTGTWGILHDYGRNNSLLINFQEHLVLTGGRIVDENDNIMFNNEAGVLALEKIVELNKLGVVDPASFGIDSGPAKRSRWIQGNEGMIFGWTADYALSNVADESKLKGEVGTGLLPAIVTSGAVTGSEGYVLSAFSKNKKAAFEFLKFVARADVQKESTIRTGWYPVKKSVFLDEEVKKANPLIDVANEQSKYPTYRFAAPYTQELNDILGPELLLAIQGKKSPKQALDDAANVLKPLIDQYK